MNHPSRGEIWYADLNPIRGHEQGGHRPVLIISVDTYNRGPSGLALIVPITSTRRGVLYHVNIYAPEGGLSNPSAALCDAIRSISRERLGRRLGKVAASTMASVEQRLKILQGL